MQLSEFPCESLTFTGVGATGQTPQQAAAALARALNRWVAEHAGQRLLQVTSMPVPADQEIGLAALLIHTASPDLSGDLAKQVAAAVEDAMDDADIAELRDPVRRARS